MLILQLGRQTGLSRAELESVYGPRAVASFGVKHVLLDAPIADVNRLGGIVRAGTVLKKTEVESEQQLFQELIKLIRRQISSKTTKVNIGVSFFGINMQAKHLVRELLGLKNTLKHDGFRVRIVNTRDIRLNSAAVIHNKLTRSPNLEVVIIGEGQQIVFSKTVSVQDIEAYTKRDRNRPKRDARVGMLPPKLAQIMLNLAQVKKNESVLDPFCGTGVVLQEALLMGAHVLGSDIDERMVRYTRENLDWLDKKGLHGGDTWLEAGDATNKVWPQPIDKVVSEIYLGTPFSTRPKRSSVEREVKIINSLLEKTLANLHQQLKTGTRLALAVPAWPIGHEIKHLPLLDRLGSLGYNRVSFMHATNEDLIYARPGQHVARELVVITRKA